MYTVRRIFLNVSALIMALAAFTGSSPQTGNAWSDDEIRSLIKKCREKSQNIIIDGKADDWSEIPRAEAKNTEASDPSRQIRKLSIAPLKDRLLVAVWTQSRPTKSPWAFYLNIETGGGGTLEFQIGFNERTKRHRIRSKHFKTYRDASPEIEIAIDDIVEMKIPYESLLAKIPDGSKRDAVRRQIQEYPFVRTTIFTYDNEKSKVVDQGVVFAAYKFTDGPTRLDADVPYDPATAEILPLPLKGMWFSQSAMFDVTKWDYDFIVRNEMMSPSKGRNSARNEEHFAWNQPVYANVEGYVYKIVNDTEDNPLSGTLPKSPKVNNGVWIRMKNKDVIALVHFRKGGVAVEKGRTVKVGDLLGYVGNSGLSWMPHLHMSMMRKNGVSPPIRLKNVLIRINPRQNDPWMRAPDVWDIRAGYFIEARQP